jgi:hypothetical protein
MREIALTRGKSTTVSDDDFEWLSKNKRSIHNCGYAYRSSKVKDDDRGKQHPIFMHREIWEHHNGPIPDGLEIDHINGNKLDNRIENLRLCTSRQNNFNRRKMETSNYKGVSWHRGNKRWRATIQEHHVGYFHTEIEAARAYDAKAKERFGEFAWLNFKED